MKKDKNGEENSEKSSRVPDFFEKRAELLKGKIEEEERSNHQGKPLTPKDKRHLEQLIEMRSEMSEEFFKAHPQYADLSDQEIIAKIDEGNENAKKQHRRNLKNHFEFFSDAVIAIIITIMLLEIGVPGKEISYLDFLGNIGIFLISFFILADLWFDHHRLYDGIEEITELIAVLDFVFLGMLSLLPLLTKWIMVEPTSFAVLNYGLVLTGIRVFMNLITLFISRERYKFLPKTKKFYLQIGKVRLITALIINLFITGIAYFFPDYGHWLFIVIPILSFLGTAGNAQENQSYYR